MRSKRPSRSKLGPDRWRGSTIIEVLMAMSVLAIGASGIMAMAKVTTVANRNAKNMAIANAIAATWEERLRTDSMLWNFPSGDNPNSDLNTDTRWLKNHVGAQGTAQWFRPVDTTLGINGVHDRFGHDDSTGQLNGPFCVNLRLVWLQPNQLLRAEVRVYWLRDGIQASAGSLSMTVPTPLCGASSSPVPAVDNASDIFHFVQVATTLTKNEPR